MGDEVPFILEKDPRKIAKGDIRELARLYPTADWRHIARLYYSELLRMEKAGGMPQFRNMLVCKHVHYTLKGEGHKRGENGRTEFEKAHLESQLLKPESEPV